MSNTPKIAVLLPCYNEAISIEQTVNAFRQALPSATIYVYDNNSTDQTAQIAKKAGAIVRSERHPGKGNVVKRMFSDIEADIYLMSDGDTTYDAKAAPKLIQKLINENLDMVVGARQDDQRPKGETYRPGHRFGNALFTSIVTLLFGKQFDDILSGYRAFSRRFVKSFPAASKGFEIETELTIHSLELRLPVAEIPTNYFARPEGSTSKLRSYRDGFRILMRIILMLKETRPLLFFGSIFLVLCVASIALSIPLFITYMKTGLVPRFPTAILSASIMLLGFISLTCGIILDSICRKHRELKRLIYLQYRSVQES